MATYAYANRGAALPYDAPMQTVLKRNVNMPDLIANPGKLALASAPTVPLSSFTGFAAADILELFEVPAGFFLQSVGCRVTTAEGATLTGDIGNASATQTHLLAADAVGYMGTLNLNSATTQITLVTDTHLGYDNYPGVVFITAGSIDLTLNNASVDTFVADFWAVGCKVF